MAERARYRAPGFRVPSGAVRDRTVASVAVLSVCPSCGSDLLQPLRWEPHGEEEVMVDLRCPECLTWMQGCFSKDDMKELDRLQTAGREEIQSAYEHQVAEAMEALIVCLQAALALDLVGARRLRAAPRAAAAAGGLAAARDRRQDRHLVALGDLGVEAVEEADVLAAEVDVDEAAQAAVGVGDPLAQLAVLGVERLEHLADRARRRPAPRWRRRPRRAAGWGA